MAVTRAMCPPGSLHDRFIEDLGFVVSFVMKDGHLFLSLRADGGIYESSRFLPPSPRHRNRSADSTQSGVLTVESVKQV